MKGLQRFRSSLGAKFIAILSVTLLVPLVAYTVFARWEASRSFEDVTERELERASSGVDTALRAAAEDLLTNTTDYATWPGFRKAILRDDEMWLLDNVAGWVVKYYPVDGVSIYALDGHLVAHSGEPRGEPLWDTKAIRRALAGKPGWDIVAADGRLYLVAAATVTGRGRRGPPGGVCLFARAIQQPLLAQIGAFSGTSLGLYREGRPVAFSHAEHAAVATKDLAGADGILTRGSWALRLEPLRDLSGRELGRLSVAVDESTLVDIRHDSVRDNGMALLLVLLCSVGAAAGAAAYVTRPLRRLAAAAAALRAGGIHEPLAMDRADEFGMLARTFDAMAADVESRMTQLTTTVEQLSAGISELNDIGQTLTVTRDVHGELRRLMKIIGAITASEFASVRLCDGPRVVIDVLVGHADGAAHVVAGAIEEACATAAPIDVTHIDYADTPGRPLSQPADERLSTLLAMPIVDSDVVLGVLTVGATAGRPYGQNERALLAIAANLIAFALRSNNAVARLEESHFQTVTALAEAMQAKDQYTAEHADSLAELAVSVSRRLGLDEVEVRRVQYGAVLHDIGKIGVPGAILNKPGRLTSEEFAVVAQHTLIGERILASIDHLLPVARIVRSAHERWDGGGYPDGLSGEQIPLASRIIFVCDAFHAMTSDRPYRKGLPPEEALDELRANAGTQFDPGVVGAFLAEWMGAESAPAAAPRQPAIT